MELSVLVSRPPVPSCHLVCPGEAGYSTRLLMTVSLVRNDLAANTADMSSSLTCKGSTPAIFPSFSLLLP